MSFPKLFPEHSLTQNAVIYLLLIVVIVLFNAVLHKYQMRSYDRIHDNGCFEIDPVVDADDFDFCVQEALQ